MSDYSERYGGEHSSHFLRSMLRLTFVLCSWALVAQTLQYDQPYRPQIHFSPQKNWTNDPNGLVYFHGQYHLFFQFNPFGIDWGHMSWGHAVSADLLHWRQLPIAIPEKDGEMVFTGSVVVDTDDTSGFCTPQAECLVAIYTGHRSTPRGTRQTQNLAYSTDDGRRWTRYAANPVIDLGMSDFRDPNVSWDDQRGHWLMAVSLPKEHKIRFYASSNLKQWSKLSDFGPSGDVDGDWECPDLLRIPLEGETRQVWALKVGLNPGAQQGGSGEQYFLGQFDGNRFTVSTQSGSHGWTNYGKDDYCAISFNGLSQNEKPVLIGWMSNWQYAAQLPTSPWRGQMSLPRKLSVLSDQAALALKQEPITAPLRVDERGFSALESRSLTAPFELELEFNPSVERVFGIRLYTDKSHWTEVGFDRNNRQFYMDRTKASATTIATNFPAKTVAPMVASRPYDIRLVIDRSSIEAYAQGGTIAMTNLIFPTSPTTRVAPFCSTGTAVPVTGKIWTLRSIWE